MIDLFDRYMYKQLRAYKKDKAMYCPDCSNKLSRQHTSKEVILECQKCGFIVNYPLMKTLYFHGSKAFLNKLKRYE